MFRCSGGGGGLQSSPQCFFIELFGGNPETFNRKCVEVSEEVLVGGAEAAVDHREVKLL